MPTLGMPELIVILLIAITLFGANKLSGVGGALGKNIREFKRASEGAYDEKPVEEKTE